MNTNEQAILEAYPDTISLEQFYRICHICKRKAKWFLENGYLPCQDSGKKTRRFTIRTTDALRFLRQLEEHPDLLQPPVGIFNSRYHHKECCTQTIQSGNAAAFRKYLTDLWQAEPDILTPAQIHILIGYSRPTISHWMAGGNLRFVNAASGRVVAKEWFIDFLVAYTIKRTGTRSEKHRKIIGGFRRVNKDR